jgi:nucleotide-binding universal stress UspA family protein
MIDGALGVAALLAATFAAGLIAAYVVVGRRGRRASTPAGTGRILLPFTGTSISRRSLEAAVRLARAEDATIMPTFLAQVPRWLPLDAPLPKQCLRSMPLLEAIEQRAIARGVAVDSRIVRGRSYRDALIRVIEQEPVDRIIVSTTHLAGVGLTDSDLQWLLRKAPAEVIILRPGMEDHRTIGADAIEGHF